MLDLRFLARRKTLAAIAILTIGLALGANTAALSVLDAFLGSSLGVPDPDRVVVVAPERNLPGRGSVVFSDAWPNYQLLRQTQRSFTDVATLTQSSVGLDDHGESRQLAATLATASFFNTLRVRPMLGRGFTEAEEGPSPAPVIVLSHALWQSTFAGDSSLVGKTIPINGTPRTVIGVMPDGFSQPVPTDVWLPFDIPASQRVAISGARALTIFARLADGKTLDGARKDMNAFTARSIELSPADNKDYRYNVTTLRATLLSGADSTARFVLAGAAGLFLLAILNLGALLIAWGFERRQEVAVRLALGASEGGVIRLLLKQSVAIVTAGAVVGVGLAFATLRLMQDYDLGPTVSPFIARAHLDFRILLATAFITLVSGLVAGALPALLTRGIGLGDALRSSTRSSTLSPGAVRWQKAMVVAQSAVSVVILAVAVLVGVSFWKLSSVPNGFTPGGKVVARLVLPDAAYAKAPQRAAFGRALDEALTREPEIVRAGFTTTLPVSDQTSGNRFFVELPDGSLSAEPILFHIRRVSPTYLSTMGIPMLRGRDFTAQDDSGAVPVAIVSRALADRLWRGQEAIGQRLLRAGAGKAPPTTLLVVGVAGNTMDAGYSSPAGETVYLPFAQVPATRLSIVAQSRGNVAATTAAIRRAIRSADPVVAAGNVATLDALVTQANALPRLRTLMLLLFATVAIGLVSLGSYGVMSQLVSSREREMAVRLVFGASPAGLGRSVIAQVAALSLPGIAIGAAIVLALSGAVKTFVFGIQPTSPLVLGAAALALLALSIAAALPSALRAMRIDMRRGVLGG